ncbi:transcriptional regulator [Kitasatospora sp. NBC_01287]|uniref:transcriptional regulator n=1 Tax=Kitasatospora sp. NBC_01287 TaxID=2903573 RepID=UPI002256D257|nr:transcriptional regulator [Kitasatospora sp. NBC_01287]MCX4750503.1 transcriptional regulator [Kitasatospora sp. NBC_01287]
MEPNVLLEVLIEEAGWSHGGLAARVNQASARSAKRTRYDHTAVARWLRGERPRGQVPALLCEAFSCHLGRPISLDDIGMGTPNALPRPTALGTFVDRATALWRSDQQHRSKVESTPAIVGTPAIVPVWEWENPPEDADVSRVGSLRVGQADLVMLRTARTHYEQMYRASGGVATRDRVVGFLATHTAPLVRGTYTDAVGRDLLRATGGLVAVAGICAYDSDHQGLAQRYFHHALRLAKASGDRAFGGYVVALLVNQALFLRDYRQAVGFAEVGVRSAGAAISPALATDLSAMQAKAFARMGDAAGAHRAMARAEAAAASIRHEEEPPETGYVQPGLVEAQLAEALISLGDWSPARTYAEEAVRVQAHPRGQVHRMATLTTVDIGRGEVEQAAANAVSALRLAGGMESQRLRDRFVALRRQLVNHRTAAARDAVDRIDASLSVPL